MFGWHTVRYHLSTDWCANVHDNEQNEIRPWPMAKKYAIYDQIIWKIEKFLHTFFANFETFRETRAINRFYFVQAVSDVRDWTGGLHVNADLWKYRFVDIILSMYFTFTYQQILRLICGVTCWIDTTANSARSCHNYVKLWRPLNDWFKCEWDFEIEMKTCEKILKKMLEMIQHAKNLHKQNIKIGQKNEKKLFCTFFEHFLR